LLRELGFNEKVPIFKEESENNIKGARVSLAGFKVNLAGHESTADRLVNIWLKAHT
jgi:hypothetical protein